MNRKAISFLMPLFAVAIGILLVSSLFTYLSYDEDARLKAPKLGLDQEAIFGAYAMQDSIKEYAQSAAEQALEIAATQDAQDYDTAAAAEFTRLMHQHPQVPKSSRFIVENIGDEYTFKPESPFTVTLRAGELVSSQSHVAWQGGYYTQWPLDDGVVTNRLTCLFGHRDISPPATKNHAGIDIDAEEGDPVYSIAPGEVVDIEENYRITIKHEGGYTCDYIHVIEEKDLPIGTSVSQGQTIATIKGPTSTHLDLRCFNHENPLTYEQAEQLFTPERVNTYNTDTTTSPYAIDYLGPIYIDSYCLFTPEIRSRLTHIDLCNNQHIEYRREGLIEHKLLETCEIYQQKGLLSNFESSPTDETEPSPLTGASIRILNEDTLPHSTTPPTPESVNDWIETTFFALRNNGDGQTTNLELVNRIAEDEGVDKKLILAMIVIESKGEPNAVSNTSVCGLMQVTEGTVGDMLGEYSGSRCTPQNQVRAGARYIKFLSERYAQTAEPLAMMAAAYNGGFGTIDNAVDDTGVPNPTFYDVAAELVGTDAKNTEIVNHAIRFTRVYDRLGGSDLQLATTLGGRTQAVGEYTFDIVVTATITDDQKTLLQDTENLIERLESTPVSQQETINDILTDERYHVRLENLTDCTTAAGSLNSVGQRCRAEFEQSCGCEVEIPETTDLVVFQNTDVTERIGEETRVSRADWAGETENPENVIISSIDESGDEGSLAVNYNADNPNQIVVGANIYPIDGAFYYQPSNTTDDKVSIIVRNDIPACSQKKFRAYCNNDYRFEILHAPS